MGWILEQTGISCLCPSPVEAIKSGAIDIVEAVQNGVASIDEVAEAATNYVGKNIDELKDEIGEGIETLADISNELFDRLLKPAIDKLLEWIKFMFESILEGANFVLKGITDVVFGTSKFIYKCIFKVCLDEYTVEDVVRDIFDKVCQLCGTDLDTIETYIEETEPFATMISIFQTLSDIVDKIKSIVTAPQRFLEDLVDQYVRPFIVDFFGDLLPLDAIPIDGIEDLVLNVAVDNLFINAIGQLFGDVTMGMQRSMDHIVEFLVNFVGSEVMDGAEDPADAGLPSWTIKALGIVLALCGVVVGFIGFNDQVKDIMAGEAKPGQVGTVIAALGFMLAYMNVVNSIANSASSGKFDEDLTKHLNGVKVTKDFALSNSTALTITIIGLVDQIIGGATPYEYLVSGVSLVICIVGFLCAITTNGIAGDPILVSLVELYEELGYGEGEEPNLTEAARANGTITSDLASKINIPATLNATPIIQVEKPFYGPGPDLLYYCFTDTEYAEQVAEDLIDNDGNIMVWVYTKVRNESIAQSRINIRFYYRINKGALQLIGEATNNKEDGDVIGPKEVLDYWYQEWTVSPDMVPDIIRGTLEIVARVEVDGNYDEQKSDLQTYKILKIPPYFKMDPITLTSSGEIQTTTHEDSEISVVREGDILTLTTEIKNTGGSFAHTTHFPVRWYLDDGTGQLKQIAKQIYASPNDQDFEYNDKLDVRFDIDTTNLGLCSRGIKGWIRHLKVALLEQDFDKCIGENIPLFSGPNMEKEKELWVEFNCWAPELSRPTISFSNQTPTEGQTIISRCKLQNVGKGPLNLRKGDLKLIELDIKKLELNSTEFKRFFDIELTEGNFELIPFDNGTSNLASECNKISFEFIPTSDYWIDAIELKSLGASEEIRFQDLNISYLGYTIAEFNEYSSEEGIHYLQNPIILREGEKYFFEFTDISGEIMIQDGIYSIAGRNVIENSVITLNNDSLLYYHPKLKLHCSKTLPPSSHGFVEKIIETEDKITTRYIKWAYDSEQLNIHTSHEEGIAIIEKEVRAFKLECRKKRKFMGHIPNIEYTLKLIKENDVDAVDIEVSLIPPSTQEDEFIPYLKEGSIPVENFTCRLTDTKPKVFLAGISASKNIRAGSSFSFSVIATAKVEEQDIERKTDLSFTLTKDISSIFSITCEKSTDRLQQTYKTSYQLELINNTNKSLFFELESTGESETEPQKWDYLFFTNKKKTYKRELGGGKMNLRFDVISKTKTESVEVRNLVMTTYSWDPMNLGNEKFILQKELGLLSIFEEKPHPLAMVFRASPNAADPGISVKLIAQFHIFPSAEMDIYNVSIEQKGDVESISRPPRRFQLERGKTRKATWEVKIPEDAPIGNKIPIRLIGKIAEDPREISSIVNLNVTNFRNNFEFALKTDWRILPVVKGKSSTIKISVENLGKKTDTINVNLRDNLPRGWYYSPNRRRLSLLPDGKASFEVSIHAPKTAKTGEGGIITVIGVSRGNDSLSQTKRVTVKAARPGSKWSILLKSNKNEGIIPVKGGGATFDLTLINNGNRPLGDVKLYIKHNYQPIQFKTSIEPNVVNLRRMGSVKAAKATIEPRICGPGAYAFSIVGRWEERILYAQDEKRVQVKYGKMAFLKSKYGILTIGAVIAIIITIIVIISILTNI